MIFKQDSDRSPVLSIALSGNLSIRELTEIADKIVKVPLERSPGVGEVQIVGGLERAINIWVEADRLAAYQLPITEVRDALQQQNADVPGGNVTTAVSERTLRTMGRFTEAEQFNDLVIATRNGAPIRVRDIGRAEDGTKEQRSFARLNGVPTVVLEVRRQSGANTVAVIEAAKASLERIRPQLPAGVTIEIVRDQSTHIYASLHEINVHLILGSILACLVVFCVHARLARHGHRRRRHPDVGHLDVRHDGGARLHAQHRDDARARADGRHRHRRRDRGAREHLPLHRREEDGAVRGGARGDRRDRAAGAGDDAEPGRDLHPGLVHVEHLGTVPLPVRHHGGVRDPGQPAGVVHADADDERAHVPARQADARAHGVTARIRARASTASIDRIYTRTLAWALAPARASSPSSAVARHRCRRSRSTAWCGRTSCPSGVDEAQFEMSVTAPEGASVAAMDDAMRAIEARAASRFPAIRLVLTTIAGGPFGTVNEAQVVRRASRRTRSASSR